MSDDDMIDISTVDRSTLPAWQTAPERIALQLGDEPEDWMSDFGDCSEVTWCAESVMDVEIGYVRADLYEAERARADALAEELKALLEQLKAALDLPDCDFPKWKELLIADMQTSYDTDGITHEDSGDPLIYLQSAIAIIEDFAAPAPASPSEQDEQPQCYYVGMIDGQHVVSMVDGSLVPAHGTAYYTRHAPASQERALPEGWVTIGVGDGSGSLFVHGPYEAVKECQRKLLAAAQDDAMDAEILRIADAMQSVAGPGAPYASASVPRYAVLGWVEQIRAILAAKGEGK